MLFLLCETHLGALKHLQHTVRVLVGMHVLRGWGVGFMIVCVGSAYLNSIGHH